MYVYNARIVKWVDGDTVDLDIDLGFGLVYTNQRIRLYGIDAFESRTRDLEEKQKGLAAKEFVNQIAPEGTSIKLKTHKSGKYGRILGEIILTYNNKETNLNLLLIEEGHAEEYLL